MNKTKGSEERKDISKGYKQGGQLGTCHSGPHEMTTAGQRWFIRGHKEEPDSRYISKVELPGSGDKRLWRRKMTPGFWA